jgi:hypothetical protein
MAHEFWGFDDSDKLEGLSDTKECAFLKPAKGQ